MIRKLEVEGWSKPIKTPLNFNEDLNIITGANGSGKTTVLKLMWYLISGNLQRILPEIPFDFVSIVTDLFSLTVTRLDSDRVRFVSEKNTFSENVDFTVTVNQETGDLGRREYIEKLHELNVDIAKAMKSSLFFPTFRRIEGGFSHVPEYADANSRRYQPSRIMRSYSSYRIEEMLEVQEAISEFSDGVSVDDHKFIASISTHDIVELIKQKHDNISDEANKRRRDTSDQVTQRIRDYKGESDDTQDLQEAKNLLDDIQKRFEKVDREQEELFQPISVLSKYVNDFFKDYGILINENITLGYDTEAISHAISSDKLSAGEKQMLSFLCYNAFSEETFIFIDEPELSLHVDWQRLLSPTLLKQGTGNQFFIATHSPFIYSAYPQNEIPLDENRGDSQGEINAYNESY